MRGRARAASAAAALAAALALSVPPAARAAFELGDASPGSLGAAAPEGPRVWLAPGWAGAAPSAGGAIAFHHASLFGAPDLVADGAVVSYAGAHAGASLEAMQVSAPAARERTLRLRLREAGARALQIEVAFERLDLAVVGAPSRGGWAMGGGVTGRTAVRGVEWRVAVAADRVARSRELDPLGVLAEFRGEATAATSAAALTVGGRWGGDGSRRPRVTLDLPLGGSVLLRVGRSASPGAVGAALAVRAGRCQIAAGRLEDPTGAGIAAVEVTFLAKSKEGGSAASGRRSATMDSGCSEPASAAPGAPLVPLWGSWASATMLRDREIRRIDPVRGAAPDSTWLPEALEDLESPESLDDPGEAAHAGVSLATNPGRGDASRLWFEGDEVSLVLAKQGKEHEAGVVSTLGPVSLAAGALAAPGMGLVGERSRLVRAARGTGMAAPSGEAFRPAWGSGVDMDGVALSWGIRPARRPRRGIGARSAPRSRLGARVVGGSRARAEGPVVAGEIRATIGAASAVVIRAARWREPAGEGSPAGGRVAAGVGWSRHDGPRRVAAEIAGDASGIHADVGASTRARSFAVAMRWRHRAAAVRPGGLDLEAGWSRRHGAARFRWRAWTTRGDGAAGRTAADDGRAELDFRVGRGSAGTTRLRLGAKPRQTGGPAGERLMVADVVAARERGRMLRLFASVRMASVGSRWRYGRAWGASLRIERGGRFAIDLRAEAVRAEPSTTAAVSAFDVSGVGSLRSRSRSGVRLAARAWTSFGAGRAGVAVDDEETTETTRSRAPRASLWITWNRIPGAP